MSRHPSVATMWREFLISQGEEPDTSAKTYSAWHFELTETAADKLVSLVLAGQKRGTASCLWALLHDGDAVPQTGDYSIVTRWDGTASCIIQTTQVEIVPYEAVTAEFARQEGEGDGSLAYWQRVHIPFFTAECQRIGREFTASMPVVCEAFAVVFPTAVADDPKGDNRAGDRSPVQKL
jgi:uncharacterized protein YhfF